MFTFSAVFAQGNTRVDHLEPEQALKLVHAHLEVLDQKFAPTYSGKDSLVLITGKILVGQIGEKYQNSFEFISMNKKGKTKQRFYETDMVYAVYKADGTEEIWYKYDERKGFSMTQEEMKYFIYGAFEAQENFKSNAVGYLGGAYGVLIGYAGSDNFFTFLAPFFYVVTVGISSSTVTIDENDTMAMRNYQAYMAGYQQHARSKKMVLAGWTSVLGTAVGVGMGSLIK